MVLKSLDSFETREKEVFKLFCEIRKRTGYEFIEGLKEFYEVIDKYPPDPQNKLEKDLFNLFKSTYRHADKSLQREAIYRESGEPVALLYANLFREEFFTERKELKKRIFSARELLKDHIGGAYEGRKE